MTIVYVVLAVTGGLAVFLTLIAVNLVSVMILREIAANQGRGPQIVIEEGEPGVYDPDSIKGKEPGTLQEQYEQLEEAMSRVDTDVEDLVAGL